MRSVLLLLAVSLSLLSPFSINVPLQKDTCIMTIDVCHANSVVSLDSEMPVINECAGCMAPLEMAGLVEIPDHRQDPDVIFSQLDRPPRS